MFRGSEDIGKYTKCRVQSLILMIHPLSSIGDVTGELLATGKENGEN